MRILPGDSRTSETKFLILFAVISSVAIFAASGAAAQDQTGRAADIKAMLQKISGQDAVDRVVAVQDALGSEDPVLRSLVLEKALASDDRRVRAVALAYLMNVQKRLVVEVTVPQKALDELEEKRRYSEEQAFRQARLLEINVREFNKSTNQFSAISGPFGLVTGAVGQDGLTVVLTQACKLRLPSAERGYLIGSFACGETSFLAEASLP